MFRKCSTMLWLAAVLGCFESLLVIAKADDSTTRSPTIRIVNRFGAALEIWYYPRGNPKWNKAVITSPGTVDLHIVSNEDYYMVARDGHGVDDPVAWVPAARIVQFDPSARVVLMGGYHTEERTEDCVERACREVVQKRSVVVYEQVCRQVPENVTVYVWNGRAYVPQILTRMRVVSEVVPRTVEQEYKVMVPYTVTRQVTRTVRVPHVDAFIEVSGKVISLDEYVERIGK